MKLRADSSSCVIQQATQPKELKRTVSRTHNKTSFSAETICCENLEQIMMQKQSSVDTNYGVAFVETTLCKTKVKPKFPFSHLHCTWHHHHVAMANKVNETHSDATLSFANIRFWKNYIVNPVHARNGIPLNYYYYFIIIILCQELLSKTSKNTRIRFDYTKYQNNGTQFTPIRSRSHSRSMTLLIPTNFA